MDSGEGGKRFSSVVIHAKYIFDQKIHSNLKDWAGQIFTDFGDRVFWNWEWNSTHYPGLDTLIPEMAQEGVCFLNYINPHFINSPDSDLYVYGEEHAYFVKNKTTGGTLLQNFGFDPFKGTVSECLQISNTVRRKHLRMETVSFRISDINRHS